MLRGDKENAMYAIAGVTVIRFGRCHCAARAGAPVRVIVRDAARAPRGEPRARGRRRLARRSRALAAALAGARGAFVLLPRPGRDQRESARAMPSSRRRSPRRSRPRACRTCAAVVDRRPAPRRNRADRALHRAERDLAATGAAVTAIRAAYFQDNWALCSRDRPGALRRLYVRRALSAGRHRGHRQDRRGGARRGCAAGGRG